YFAQGEFVRGFLLDRLWHLALPVLCLSYGGFAFLSKLARTSVLENLLADYARTARAKGVSERDVLWRHVFRNSLLPLITVAASLLPGLLGGSVIVESIFSIEGMGKLAVEAVKGRDRELVLSITLISGLLTLAGYLLADLCYAIADPRVSYD
ncbi:MAG: ABC transporter permease, partial [Pseudomonadota bacterium]